MRGASGKLLENRGEMSLCPETHGQSDLDNRECALAQQAFGALNTSPQQELVRPQAGCHPELGREVHSAQPCNRRKLGEADPF
jgi:hypothetical protein